MLVLISLADPRLPKKHMNFGGFKYASMLKALTFPDPAAKNTSSLASYNCGNDSLSEQTSVSHLTCGAAQKGTKLFCKETNKNLLVRPRRGRLRAGLHCSAVSRVLFKCTRICKTWNRDHIPFSNLVCCIQLKTLSTTTCEQPAVWEASLNSVGRIESCRAGV